MNLFLGLRGRGVEAGMDTGTAVMVPIIAAMLADGRVEEAELAEIEAIYANSPIFERDSAVENDRRTVYVTRLIEDHGLETMCRRASEVLSPALRETAFAYAVEMVFSDGYVGTIERAVLGDLMQWLDIQPERARTLIDVVSVMQHPASA